MGARRNRAGFLPPALQGGAGRREKAFLSALALLAILGGSPCPAQEGKVPPPPPRPRSPLAGKKSLSKTLEFLALLKKIREAKTRALEASRAFEKEKKVLEEEIQALQKRVEGEKAEWERRTRETRTRLEAEKKARERAKAREAFLLEAGRAGKEKAAGIASLPRPMSSPGLRPPSSLPPLQVPAFLGRLFLELETLSGRARSVETWRKRVVKKGKTTFRDYLRLGGVLLLWRSLDGKEAGWVEGKTGKEIPFPPGLRARASREIARAVEILERRRAPELCLLPFPLLPKGKKEEKR